MTTNYTKLWDVVTTTTTTTTTVAVKHRIGQSNQQLPTTKRRSLSSPSSSSFDNNNNNNNNNGSVLLRSNGRHITHNRVVDGRTVSSLLWSYGTTYKNTATTKTTTVPFLSSTTTSLSLNRRLLSSTSIDRTEDETTTNTTLQEVPSSPSQQQQQQQQETPSLKLWKQMIQTIPIHLILPIGMMSPTDQLQQPQPQTHTDNITVVVPNDRANRTAFYGDKVLNYYISQQLRNTHHSSSSALSSLLTDDVIVDHNLILTVPTTTNTDTNHSTDTNESHYIPTNISSTYTGIDIGYMTLVQGEAMSNQLYSTMFEEIMGTHPAMTPELIQLAKQQVHDAGTMIEATVDALFMMKQQPSADDTTTTTTAVTAAIQELATYLVHNAYERTTYFNAKGQLLELGGTVISYKTEDSLIHLPKFRAIATYNNISYISDPPSTTKKMAEQIAATQLLKQNNHQRQQPIMKQRITFTNTTTTTNNNDAASVGAGTDAENGTATTTSTSNDDDLEMINFDVDLMEDGALPDDFYSDITTITKQITTQQKTKSDDDDDDDNNDDDSAMDDTVRPFDAQRFQLPKLHKRNQIDFYHFNNTHTVNLRDGESPELSWRRGAYDKRSCFHRAVLSSKMLPQYIETVNSWTRQNSKEFFTVVVVLVPKPKPEDIKKSIFPIIKCFVRHDGSRNRARNAIGLVINQYIDQVVIGSSITEMSHTTRTALQPDRKVWPPKDTRNKNKNNNKPKKVTRRSGMLDHRDAEIYSRSSDDDDNDPEELDDEDVSTSRWYNTNGSDDGEDNYNKEIQK